MSLPTKKMLLAALLSPLVLLGIMVEPAQAAAGPISFYCGAGTFVSVNFSSATTPYVSEKISFPAHYGAYGEFVITDHGTVGYTRQWSNQVRQDGLWHAVQGPYNRKAGGLVDILVYMNNGSYIQKCEISRYV